MVAVRLRPTTPEDLRVVLEVEHSAEHRTFIVPWPRECLRMADGYESLVMSMLRHELERIDDPRSDEP